MSYTPRRPKQVTRSLAAALAFAAVAVLLVAAIAGPVAAGKPDTKPVKQRPFNVFATVSSVTTGTAGNSFDATVTAGNRAIRLAANTKVTFTVPAKSVIMKKAGKDKPFRRVHFGAIAVGDRVHVLGRIDASVPTAPRYVTRLILDWGPKTAPVATTTP
jgi:hypothetical protein